MIKPRRRFLSQLYFDNFRVVNVVMMSIVAIVFFFVQLSTYAIFIYLIILFGFAVYAQLNFELGRTNASLGAWCFFFLLLRTMVAVGTRAVIRSNGVDSTDLLKDFYSFISADGTIAFFAVIGLLGIYFLIRDMHIAVTKYNAIGN